MKFAFIYTPAGYRVPLTVTIDTAEASVTEAYDIFLDEIEDYTKNLEGVSKEVETLKVLRAAVTTWMDTAKCYNGCAYLKLSRLCDELIVYPQSSVENEGITRRGMSVKN